MKRYLRFEKRHEPLASRTVYSQRLLRNGFMAIVVIVIALAVGMTGYMQLESRSFVDAFESSAMILSGMGPLGDPKDYSTAGKAFEGVYAIICGLLFFAVAGLALMPVFHRILHRFHVDENDDGGKKSGTKH